MGPAGWTVRTRLSLVASISVALGLLVAAGAAYVVTYQALYRQVDESLHDAPRRVPGPGAVIGLESLCDAEATESAPSPGLFVVTILTASGRVCASDPDSMLEFTDADMKAATTGEGVGLRDGHLRDGRPVRMTVIPVEGGGAVIFARDTSSIESVLATLRWSLLAVVLVCVSLSLLFARWAARAGLKPVTQFARVAEEIAETGSVQQHASQPPTVLVAARPNDELGRLSHAFNAMTSALAEAQEQQRRLVADAGHELRTPLASLRANIGLLQRSRRLRRPLPPEDEDRLLDDLGNQAVELSVLLDDIDQLAAEPADEASHGAVRFDDAVEAALERARPRSASHVFDVTLEPWMVIGDEAAIERAVINLLDNAIKFSPPGSRIEVSLAAGTLTVADEGIGVPAEDQERVFERFWRAPQSRSMPGSGLGLSIVADVAASHGGDARVGSSTSGRGATIQLHLPGEPVHAD